jgi:proliferating cell nuclear antigen
MVLIAKLSSPTIFKQTIDAMKDLVKDVNFDCNESGIKVQCTDSSNVALVHLLLREAAFDEYQCDQPITLGVNVESLAKVFRMCGQNDKVTMTAGLDGDSNKDRVNFEFHSTTDDRVADFDMRTIEIEADSLGVPDADYDVVVHMPSSEMKKAVGDLKEFGDALQVKTSKEGIRLSASGDIGTGNVLLKVRTTGKEEEDLQIKGANPEEPMDIRFGMRYLNLFVKATPLSKRCSFSLKTGEPFSLEYPLGEDGNGFIRFLLAPKVDDE